MNAPPGPYYSTWGPLDGPILYADARQALGVVLDRDAPPMPDGIAYPVVYIEGRRGPVATFRLTIGKAEVPGRWICLRRRFERVGEEE